jgi:hypothetical protein
VKTDRLKTLSLNYLSTLMQAQKTLKKVGVATLKTAART